MIGGDFNYDLFDPQQLDFVYQKFLNDYTNKLNTGGSELALITPLAADQRRTTVQLRDHGNGHFDGPQRTGAAVGDYLSLRIDQLMYRGLAPTWAETRVYPFLDKLMQNPSPYRAVLRRYKTHFDQVIAGTGMAPDEDFGPLRPPVGLPLYPNFTDWEDFYHDINRNAARFSTARSAAEFYHIFVSDHLPLILSVSW
jgi:hypothetical protein